MTKNLSTPKKKIGLLLLAGFAFLFIACQREAMNGGAVEENSTSTLQAVLEKGFVQCGVSTGLAGFSSINSDGKWEGLDVDGCRAVAAAVLGSADKVKFSPLTAKERFTALQAGEIDLLVRNTTWTLTRDGSLGLNFAGVNYYDGQGFLVKKAIGVSEASELNGVSVCIQAGTTTELNLADYMRFNQLRYNAVTFDTSDQTVKAFEEGRCDVLTSDRSQLAALRIKLADPESAVLLTEVISKEPLGPVVRQGDDEWFNIVKWAFYAQIEAEEAGVSSANVDERRDNPDSNPTVKRLLGVEGNLGEVLGLPAEWAYNIISQVGNYGEVYERNVGSGSPLGLARGVNRLWNQGGLLYPMPFR